MAFLAPLDGAFEDVLIQIAGKADTTQVEALDAAKADHGYGEGETVKTLKEVEGELDQLAGEMSQATPEFNIINISKENIFVESNKIFFSQNPVIYNNKTNRRAFIFPLSTVFPVSISIPNNTFLVLSKALLNQTQLDGYLPQGSITQLQYGSLTDEYVPLAGKFGAEHGFGILGDVIRESLFDISVTEKAIGYSYEQGTISTVGELVDSTTRITTSYIEIGKVEYIKLPSGYKCFVAYYDGLKRFLSSNRSFSTKLRYGEIIKKAKYARVVISKNDDSAISPQSIGEEIYISSFSTLNSEINSEEITDFVWESGTLTLQQAAPSPNPTRIRSEFIPSGKNIFN